MTPDEYLVLSLVPLQDTYIDMYIKVHYSYIATYIKYMQA